MFNLEKLRLPYREDTVFSCLAFAVFIVPLVFFILTNESYETAKFSLFLILTGCALIAFLNRQYKGRLVLAYNWPLFILLGMFLAWAVLSTVFSIDVLYSIFGFYYRFTDGLVFYAAFAIFLILLTNVLDRAKLKFLFKILVFDALIISVVACLQAFNITYYVGATATGLVQGPSLLGNPDFSGMFLAAVLPFVLVFSISAEKFSAKAYYSLCVFVILTASLIFASRGALLAIIISAAAALAVMLICHFPKKLFFGLLLICALTLGYGKIFLDVSRPQAITTVVQNVDSNTTSRLAAWQISLQGLTKHPVLGSGPGAYALFFERSRPASPQVGVFDDPHNLFLRLAVTGGLPFLLIFLSLLAIAVYYGYKKINANKDLLVLACLVGLIAWCVGVSFNPAPIPMFMLLAVLLSGLLINNIHTKELTLIIWVKRFFYVLAAILIIFGIDLAISEYLFGFAKQDYLNKNYSRAYTLSVLAEKLNPTNGIYEIYRIGSEIGLNKDPRGIVKDINHFKAGHTKQAGTYVIASNMYNLLYSSTGDKEYLKSAVIEMDSSLGIDKFYAERYGQEALYYYELGDLNSAKSAVIKNLSLNDGNFAPWVLLAKIYQLDGNRPAAVQALSRAFKLRPDIPQLGFMLYVSKNTADIKSAPIQIAPIPAHLE